MFFLSCSIYSSFWSYYYCNSMSTPSLNQTSNFPIDSWLFEGVFKFTVPWYRGAWASGRNLPAGSKGTLALAWFITWCYVEVWHLQITTDLNTLHSRPLNLSNHPQSFNIVKKHSTPIIEPWVASRCGEFAIPLQDLTFSLPSTGLGSVSLYFHGNSSGFFG